MPSLIFKSAYVLGLLIETAIRVPIDRQRRQNTIVAQRVTWQERLILGVLFLGGFLLPLLYIFTPWLDFANYTLPGWAGLIGLFLLIAAVWVFWRAHADLGRNWSPSLQIRAGHTLVTHGLYRYIRHPMYASQWLWVIGQMLLLQNWLAGVSGLLAFLPLYFIRVPIEEQLMLEQFGDEYRVYMHRTGRVLPWRG
jgi:protein-S-isoprenylcysteine O-methyltransferase Ste14